MSNLKPVKPRSTRTVALPDKLPSRPTIVFTDVDDTLTHDGQLPEQTFTAMHQLRRAGFTVVPVTGACAGWCDCLIKTWPIRHIIGENGALTMHKSDEGCVSTQFSKSDEHINRDLQLLHRISTDFRQRYPDIPHTQDQLFRLTDIAFDIGQAVSINNERADEATQWLKNQGVHARRSSIHINVWLGEHSKSTAAMSWLSQRALVEADCLFIGDSPNDESMFGQFSLSVGVSNIQRFLESMEHVPAYKTTKPGGFGFVEMANVLLDADI